VEEPSWQVDSNEISSAQTRGELSPITDALIEESIDEGRDLK
jgi:hypothetical protein